MSELYWFILAVVALLLLMWNSVRYWNAHDEKIREELKKEYIAY